MMTADWAERHQTALYLVSIGLGFGVGATIGAEALEGAINPSIALLLFVTFLTVPFDRLGRALRDRRFLATLLVLDFAVVPVVVFGLSRFVAHDATLLVGALLVLLTPCIDYVIVFSALAGAAHERLLAAAPLLMLLQLALLPGYLWLFGLADRDRALSATVDVGPFVQALLVLIVVPLGLAALTQVLMRQWRPARQVAAVGATSMVPLMMLVLFVVVASQAGRITGNLIDLAAVVPVFVAFLVVMALVGALCARWARLDVPAARALTFSGATRNSLVVLPLALALPDQGLAPAVVVTQTLVELIGMVIFVRLIPRLIPEGTPKA